MTASILVCACLGGCAADGGRGPAPGAGAEILSDPLDRLTGSENGLELRTWVTGAEPTRIRSIIDAYAVDPDPVPHLERNGLRFARVRLDDLERMMEALGPIAVSVNAWHGQVPEWRDVRARVIAAPGRGLAVDGRPRRFTGGRVELILRGWTVQMEEGPRVYLELGGRFVPADAASTPFEGIDATHFLEAGSAYVVTGVVPEGGSATDTGPGPGPDVATAPTLGEFLFTDIGDRRGRGILVIVPRIAPDLFPPGPAGDGDAA